MPLLEVPGLILDRPATGNDIFEGEPCRSHVVSERPLVVVPRSTNFVSCFGLGFGLSSPSSCPMTLVFSWAFFPTDPTRSMPGFDTAAVARSLHCEKLSVVVKGRLVLVLGLAARFGRIWPSSSSLAYVLPCRDLPDTRESVLFSDSVRVVVDSSGLRAEGVVGPSSLGTGIYPGRCVYGVQRTRFQSMESSSRRHSLRQSPNVTCHATKP